MKWLAFLDDLLEPEDMMDLCNAIGEYRYQYMKLIVDHIKPDIMLSHDDWGSKNSLFVSPDTWREFIKPNYAKTYGYMKEKRCNHHASCRFLYGADRGRHGGAGN